MTDTLHNNLKESQMSLETYLRLLVGEIIFDMDYFYFDELFVKMVDSAFEICRVGNLRPMDSDVDECFFD